MNKNNRCTDEKETGSLDAARSGGVAPQSHGQSFTYLLCENSNENLPNLVLSFIVHAV